MAHVLLVETAQGAHVAVRFPDAATAREWEDKHEDVIQTAGTAPVVSAAEALRLARS